MDIHKIYRGLRFELACLKKSNQTADDALQKLEAFHYQIPPLFYQKNSLNPEYDLMIVIPVYNVEKYLKACLDSVFAQETQYSYCVVAVDDGSTDASGHILDQYCGEENLEIIHQKNKGLSGARNTALKNINARYVMFLDSDDYLPENAVQRLVETADEYDADIVQGTYAEFRENGIVREVSGHKNTCRILTKEISGFACMKIIRGERLRDFCFPEGFIYEDTVMSKLLYPVCNIAVSIPDVVYHYRQHANSISGGGQKPKNTDTYWITKYCLEEAQSRDYQMDSEMYEQYLRQCWINYLRIRYLPQEIQESIFVLTRDLFINVFSKQSCPKSRQLRMLHQAFQANSYVAYCFLMERWEII